MPGSRTSGPEPRASADGSELRFAVNDLSGFLLAHLLLPLLQASAAPASPTLVQCSYSGLDKNGRVRCRRRMNKRLAQPRYDVVSRMTLSPGGRPIPANTALKIKPEKVAQKLDLSQLRVRKW